MNVPDQTAPAGRTARGQTIALFAWVLAMLALAALGNLVTQPAIADGWYGRLAKAPFNPPGPVFGIVWTALFILQGIAAWLVWRRPRSSARSAALTAFFGQWALNFLWSVLFFGLKSPGLAFTEALILVGAVASAGWLLGRVDARAGLLFFPYGAWCAFAVVLNGWIVAAN